jgi:hypothetical protein
MATGSTTAATFACDLNETQFKLMFAEKVGSIGTFGLVGSEEEWLAKRDDPDYLVEGIPPGIGNLRRFERKVFGSGKLFMPDGERVKHWGFRDENGVEDFPSTPIRVTGGDLMQCELKSSIRQHTIHWHGIEPDMDNDGVGHTSFEVTGNYVYQWRAHPANAGTYFYHCHVNTVLHVQMGLWGALIIDPYEEETDPAVLALGRKPLHDAPDAWRYKPQYERIWAINSIDPVWHDFNHAAGLCFEDAGLNDFRPKYFGIGRSFSSPDARPLVGTAGQPVAVSAPAGENIYLRVINADYFPIDVDFGELGRDIHIIEADGRGLRDGIDIDGLGSGTGAVTVPWNDLPEKRFSSAERYGLLINSHRPGTYPVTIRHRHWVTQEVVGMTRTTVTIT